MSDKIGFRLSKIDTNQFAIIDSAFNKNNEEVDFNIETGFGINENEQLVVVHFAPALSNDKSPFLKLQVSCYFNISDKAWKSFKNNGNIVIPADFARHMLLITVGTTRGVLHARTDNTPYNKYFLQTINLNEIVTEDLVF